jgi:ATP-dependent Lhr-like helicase
VPTLFAGLRHVIVDELHAFAKDKRGDLLNLSLARLQRLAPGLRRVGLSATISDPDAYRGWLAPDADLEAVDYVEGDPGAEPDLTILIPDGRIPWSGHSGRHAAREVMELIERHKTTLIFCNTRSLAELIFQDLWAVNDKALPIGIHHGSLALEARRKVEAAMASGKLRGLVATSSLDLGLDWGDVDLVVQMGAPKGSSRLLQRIGRANHRLDEPSRGTIVPGNRFEYLEARAPRRDRRRRARPTDHSAAGRARRAPPSTSWPCLRRPFDDANCWPRSARRAYAGLTPSSSPQSWLHRRAAMPCGLRRSSGWRGADGAGGHAPAHRPAAPLNAGIIVEAPLLEVRFATAASSARSEGMPRRWRGDHFLLAGSDAGGGAVRGADSSSGDPRRTHRHLRRAAHEHVDPPREPRSSYAVQSQRLGPLPGRRQRMAGSAKRALTSSRTARTVGRNF